MEWKEAADKFLEEWKDKDYVVGAVVAGSYVTGNPTPNSDVDIHILLSDDIQWRERGNKIVNGYLIEYFANPLKRQYKYLEEDYKKRTRTTTHMFSNGLILFDKTGEVKKFVSEMKKLDKEPFEEVSKEEIEMMKYFIWDNFDNVEGHYKAGKKGFELVYYNSLYKIYSSYSKYLGETIVQPQKFYEELVDDKKVFLEKGFRDEKFCKLIEKSVNEKDKQDLVNNLKELTEYVLEQMGGFEIDGWIVRNEA